MATQLLTGTHLKGSGAPAAGRTVRATPIEGQYIDATTIDTDSLVLVAPTGSDGTWSLTLMQGVIYDIKIEKWGLRTIKISEDAEKAFVSYLGDNALLGGTTPGSVKCETGESIIPFIYQDGDGNYVISWRVL